MSTTPGRLRTVVKFPVHLEYQCNTLLNQKVHNLSLNGLLLDTKLMLPINARCKVHLVLDNLPYPTTLIIHARVIRIDPRGLALTFESMDLITFEQLKQAILEQSAVPGKFLQECESRPGFR